MKLLIYIPTVRPDELAGLLHGLRPHPNVRVHVSDNTGEAHVPGWVIYEPQHHDIGGNPNLIRAGAVAREYDTEYLWLVGDDDRLLPGAVGRVCAALGTNPDRLIVTTPHFRVPDFDGDLTDLLTHEWAGDLLVASTLITTSIVKTDLWDSDQALRKLDTNYGHVWAHAQARHYRVLSEPVFEVGVQYRAEGGFARAPIEWHALLEHYHQGAGFTNRVFQNHVSAKMAGGLDFREQVPA